MNIHFRKIAPTTGVTTFGRKFSSEISRTPRVAAYSASASAMPDDQLQRHTGADDDDGVEQVAPEPCIAQQFDVVGEADELRSAATEIVAEEAVLDRRGERVHQHHGHHREAGQHEQPHERVRYL